jgi:glycosyltransferase involved in cell wall biosynthesis
VIGVLADQKGAPTVAAVAEAADPAEIEIHLIGYPEQELPEPARARISETGQYEDAQLPALLARVRPHVLWFPAQWPETYSYTLTAAIAAGLPIVASAIGAFPERLAGRPLTWLVDPAAPAETWIETFGRVRAALQAATPKPKLRKPEPDFYAASYLRPAARPARGGRLIDLRRPDRLSVVLVPERLDTGCMSPCAYIRLLLPLDHPAIGGRTEVILADAEEARRYQADVIATHRHAIPDLAAADALASHCRSYGISLLYDLDDDLIDVPPDHPDAELLRARAAPVERMIRRASAVWVSTPALRERLARLRKEALVVPNGLDERLWSTASPPRPAPAGPVRILFMGTATHDRDLALIGPALARLRAEFGDRVSIDIIGVTSRGDLPRGVNRLVVPSAANVSYPAFVNWITRQDGWDIGLAPLADTPFNRAKSAIKAFDYAALGMPTLASDIGVYRGSTADGTGGLLVPNTPEAWYAAISRLVRNPGLRRTLAPGAQASYIQSHTLAAQADRRRSGWQAAALGEPQARSPRLKEQVG